MLNRPYVVDLDVRRQRRDGVPDIVQRAGRGRRGVALQLHDARQPGSERSVDRARSRSRRRRPRVDTDTRSVYAFDTLGFNDKWSLNLGVRWDDYGTLQNGFSGTTPQVLENDSRLLELPGGRRVQAGEQRQRVLVDRHVLEPGRQLARRRHREYRADQRGPRAGARSDPRARHQVGARAATACR